MKVDHEVVIGVVSYSGIECGKTWIIVDGSDSRVFLSGEDIF
jgi:hypothetical protein